MPHKIWVSPRKKEPPKKSADIQARKTKLYYSGKTVIDIKVEFGDKELFGHPKIVP